MFQAADAANVEAEMEATKQKIEKCKAKETTLLDKVNEATPLIAVFLKNVSR